MKATIVLLANSEAENFGRNLMLEAHRAGDLGFEMARLPQHVSLKQPFSIPSLEEIAEFFVNYAKEQNPVEVIFEELEVCPSNVLGGNPSGVLSLRVKESEILRKMQKELFTKLEERFGPCPAEHDHDYVFHMTVALGRAPFANYEKAHRELRADAELWKDMEEKAFCFDKLGLLYYDDDNICPGTYFCYKVYDL